MVRKDGKLSVARQGLDVLIIAEHRGWVERGELFPDAINLEKLSTVIIHVACICLLQILLRLWRETLRQKEEKEAELLEH